MGFDTREPEDLKLYSEALQGIVGIGMKLDRAWAQDKLRIPEPGEKDDVLSVPNPEMAVPLALRKKQTQAAARCGQGRAEGGFRRNVRRV